MFPHLLFYLIVPLKKRAEGVIKKLRGVNDLKPLNKNVHKLWAQMSLNHENKLFGKPSL